MGQLWYGSEYVPPQTGSDDDIHFSRYDKPSDSPQLGGKPLPPKTPRLKGAGIRAGERGKKAKKSFFTHTKSSKHEQEGRVYQNSQKRDPDSHPRKYCMNQHYRVDLVPAPSAAQRVTPTATSRMMPTGVLHTFIEMPAVMPVVPERNHTSEEIRAHFPAPGNWS